MNVTCIDLVYTNVLSETHYVITKYAFPTSFAFVDKDNLPLLEAFLEPCADEIEEIVVLSSYYTLSQQA